MFTFFQEYAQGLLDSHYKSVKYEKTDNRVPWNVIKNLYKHNGSVLSDENLICAISYLKKEGKCSVGMSSEGEKVGETCFYVPNGAILFVRYTRVRT